MDRIIREKIHPYLMGGKYDGLVFLDVECRDDDVCEGLLECQLRAASLFEHFFDRFAKIIIAVFRVQESV